MLQRRGFILSALLAPFAPLLARLRPAAAPTPTYKGIPLEYVSQLDEVIVYETYVPDENGGEIWRLGRAAKGGWGVDPDLCQGLAPSERKENVRW